MGRANILKYSLRLNLQNEQHQRVVQVLNELNTDAHKSVNQFIIKALDAYINSFGEEEISSRAKKEEEFISREDLESIRQELKSEIKDEVIRVLGIAIAGGPSMRVEVRNSQHEAGTQELEADATVSSLANKWG